MILHKYMPRSQNIQKEDSSYTFTNDWFSNNIPRWEKFLKPLAGMPLKVLELGSYEGKSAIWLLENILTHQRARITCIDNFGSDVSNTEIHKRFVENTKRFGKKIQLLKMNTRDALKTPKIIQQEFDIIYIDAGRHSKNVLEDAVLSFPLLKAGGIIIFDDYTTSKLHDYTCPKKGIDTFLDIFSDELRVRHSSWQVVAIKKVPKVKAKACKSEFYARA